MMTPHELRIFGKLAIAIGLVVAGHVTPARAQTSNAKGKISRNVYRIPYSSGDSIHVTHDYVDHGNSPAGDTGPMDMNDETSAGREILAAAAGQVISVNDSLNGCGCHSAYGPCPNSVRIRHANGEISTYLHIAQFSAGDRGIAPGVNVVQGQPIGREGEVGWTCGSDHTPRSSTCVPVVPSGTGDCGLHLHWVVSRESTGERVNPMTCGISNNIYANDTSYTSGVCNPAQCATNNTVPPGALYSGFGVFRVIQAHSTITGLVATVKDNASLVLHAGTSVRLTPGFHAVAGGYMRAEIGICNTTATAPTTTAGEEEAPVNLGTTSDDVWGY